MKLTGLSASANYILNWASGDPETIAAGDDGSYTVLEAHRGNTLVSIQAKSTDTVKKTDSDPQTLNAYVPASITLTFPSFVTAKYDTDKAITSGTPFTITKDETIVFTVTGDYALTLNGVTAPNGMVFDANAKTLTGKPTANARSAELFVQFKKPAVIKDAENPRLYSGFLYDLTYLVTFSDDTAIDVTKTKLQDSQDTSYSYDFSTDIDAKGKTITSVQVKAQTVNTVSVLASEAQMLTEPIPYKLSVTAPASTTVTGTLTQYVASGSAIQNIVITSAENTWFSEIIVNGSEDLYTKLEPNSTESFELDQDGLHIRIEADAQKNIWTMTISSNGISQDTTVSMGVSSLSKEDVSTVVLAKETAGYVINGFVLNEVYAVASDNTVLFPDKVPYNVTTADDEDIEIDQSQAGVTLTIVHKGKLHKTQDSDPKTIYIPRKMTMNISSHIAVTDTKNGNVALVLDNGSYLFKSDVDLLLTPKAGTAVDAVNSVIPNGMTLTAVEGANTYKLTGKPNSTTVLSEIDLIAKYNQPQLLTIEKKMNGETWTGSYYLKGLSAEPDAALAEYTYRITMTKSGKDDVKLDFTTDTESTEYTILSEYAGYTISGVQILKNETGLVSASEAAVVSLYVPTSLEVVLTDNSSRDNTAGELIQKDIAKDGTITKIDINAASKFRFPLDAADDTKPASPIFTDTEGTEHSGTYDSTSNAYTYAGITVAFNAKRTSASITGSPTENLKVSFEPMKYDINVTPILVDSTRMILMVSKGTLMATEDTITGVKLKTQDGEYGALYGPKTSLNTQAQSDTNGQMIIEINGLTANTAYTVTPVLSTDVLSEEHAVITTSAAVGSDHLSMNLSGSVLQTYGKGNLQITYSNRGWQFENYINNNLQYAVYTSNDTDDVGRFTIVLRNNTAETISGSKFAFHADVMIGINDKAPIFNQVNQGFMMADNASLADNVKVFLLLNEGSKVKNNWDPASNSESPVKTTKWWGYYSDASSNAYNDLTGHATLTGTDSGAAFSWQNISVPAGETRVYTFLLAAGNAGDLGDYIQRDITYNLTYKGLKAEAEKPSSEDHLLWGITSTGTAYDGNATGQFFAAPKDPTQPGSINYKLTAAAGFVLPDSFKLNDDTQTVITAGAETLKGVKYTVSEDHKTGVVTISRTDTASVDTQMQIIATTSISGQFAANGTMTGTVFVKSLDGDTVYQKAINSDGSFTIENVQFGNYILSVRAKDKSGSLSHTGKLDIITNEDGSARVIDTIPTSLQSGRLISGESNTNLTGIHVYNEKLIEDTEVQLSTFVDSYGYRYYDAAGVKDDSAYAIAYNADSSCWQKIIFDSHENGDGTITGEADFSLVNGSVLLLSSDNKVVDFYSRSAENATVQLQTANGNTAAETLTNAYGMFALQGVSKEGGTYKLYAENDKKTQEYLETVAVTGFPVASMTGVSNPIRLKPAIKGTITNINGNPVSGAIVYIKDADGNVTQTITTDSAGKYYTYAEANGKYLLVSNYHEGQADVLSATKNLSVSSGATQSGDMTIAAGNLAIGYVKPARNSVTVKIYEKGTSNLIASTKTINSGRFEIGGLLADTEYTVIAGDGAGSVTTVLKTEKLPNEDTPQEYELVTGTINLDPSILLSGKVTMTVNNATTLIKDATVVIKNAAGKTVSTTVSDSLGSYDIPGFGAGVYYASAVKGTNAGTTHFTLDSAGLIVSGTADIQMQNGTLYQGRLLQTDGQPAKANSVIRFYKDNVLKAAAYTNDIGEYSAEGLEAGVSYSAQADIFGENGGTVSIAAVSKDDTEHTIADITADKGIDVQVNLTNDWSVMKTALVTVMQGSKEVAQKTAENGSVTIKNLKEGTYSIKITLSAGADTMYSIASLSIANDGTITLTQKDAIDNSAVKAELVNAVDGKNITIGISKIDGASNDVTDFIAAIDALPDTLKAEEINAAIIAKLNAVLSAYQSLNQVEMSMIAEYMDKLNMLMNAYQQYKGYKVLSDIDQAEIPNLIKQNGVEEAAKGLIPASLINVLNEENPLILQLKIRDITANLSEAQEADLNELLRVMPNIEPGMILDISLFAYPKNDTGNRKQLTHLNSDIEILIEIPEYMDEQYFAVASVHEGKLSLYIPEIISMQKETEDGIVNCRALRLKTRDFSTFMLLNAATPFAAITSAPDSSNSSSTGTWQEGYLNVGITHTLGGSVNADAWNQYYWYSTIEYRFTANRGYHVKDVLVDGKSIGAVTYYSIKRIDADHTIHVVFAKNNSGTKNTSVDTGDQSAASAKAEALLERNKTEKTLKNYNLWWNILVIAIGAGYLYYRKRSKTKAE